MSHPSYRSQRTVLFPFLLQTGPIPAPQFGSACLPETTVSRSAVVVTRVTQRAEGLLISTTMFEEWETGDDGNPSAPPDIGVPIRAVGVDP